jgi:hypothetical protein
MTSPQPDELRDVRFDAAWRAASHEEPSVALDDAIRAAARREVDAGPRPVPSATLAARVPNATRPERWWWPLAAAATIGAITFGLLQLEPTGNGGPAVVSDMPATVTQSAQAPAATPTPASAPTSKPAGQHAAPATTPQAFGVAPAPDALPARESDSATESRIDAKQGGREGATGTGIAGGTALPPAARRESDRMTARESPEVTKASATSGVGKTAQARPRDGAPLPADEWIALIRRLRSEGKTELAARELLAFRAAYPDHKQRLPLDLRVWHPPAE